MELKFSSPTHALYWYYETFICLTNARSLDVFYEKCFSYRGKSFSLSRMEMMTTLGYYINKLSRDCRFIIKGRYLANMGFEDIAKMLNEIQNTKKFYPKLVEQIYVANLRVIRKFLKEAELLREEK